MPITIRRKAISTDELFRGTDRSLWQFWNHGVTSSFLGTYLDCREQARLYYVEGWTPDSSPLAIEFGSCCHWILQYAYSESLGYLAKMLKQKREKAVEDWVKDMVKKYDDFWGKENPYPKPKMLEQQELVYGMAEIVLPVYFLRWSGDFTGQYEFKNNTTAPKSWMSLELLFKQSYEFADGKEVPVRGRRDGVFLDRRGGTWVFDTKCLSVIKNDDILDMLPVNLQQMEYLWVTTQEAKESGATPPCGCIMNVIRRPGHRRAVNEKLPHFLERIQNDIRNPKKFDHNFIRYQMSITQGELADWKRRTFDPLMSEVRGWWEGSVPHYASHQHAITKYGRCGLFLPVVKGEFHGVHKRNHAFSELKEV